MFSCRRYVDTYTASAIIDLPHNIIVPCYAVTLAALSRAASGSPYEHQSRATTRIPGRCPSCFVASPLRHFTRPKCCAPVPHASRICRASPFLGSGHGRLLGTSDGTLSCLALYSSSTSRADSTEDKSNTSAAEALKEAIRILDQQNVPEAEASAEVLLSAVMGTSRSAIRLRGKDIILTGEQKKLYDRYISERVERKPVQYIIGEWEFYNLDKLIVRPPTLIPRPETEELVDMIIKAHPNPPRTFLEVGSGSGAICLSLLRAWPKCTAVAVDVCEHAVQLTSDNAVMLGMADRLTVVHSSIEYYSMKQTGQPCFDLLVSNPPYIPTKDLEGLSPEVIDFEDEIALDGGPDGLIVIRQILHAALTLVKNDGDIWMEVDTSHPERLAVEHERGTRYAVRDAVRGDTAVDMVGWSNDLCGRPRFVHYRLVKRS